MARTIGGRMGFALLMIAAASFIAGCGTPLTRTTPQNGPTQAPPSPSASPNAADAISSASVLPTSAATPTPTGALPRPTGANPPVPCSGVNVSTQTGPAAPLIYAGARSARVIAITVDDGWSDAAVLTDLAIFEREHVNATFFPIGEAVERSPAVWRAVAAAGFPIGNHTYDHRNLKCLSYPDALADIERDNAVVSGIIGKPLLPILRPPGGNVDLLVRQAAYAAGERDVVNWDTVDGDTARDGDNVQLLIANAEKGRAGSILLVHANEPYTQQALPAIIAFYRAKGFTFVTLGQMLGLGGPVPFK